MSDYLIKGEEYLIIDKRTFVGNDVLFWGKNGSGYTTDIDKAQVYNKEDARKLDGGRSTDVAITLDEVKKKCRRVVDFQYMDRDIFRAGYSCFTENNSKTDHEVKIDQLNKKLNRIENLFSDLDYAVHEYNVPFSEAIEKIKAEAAKIISEKIAK